MLGGWRTSTILLLIHKIIIIITNLFRQVFNVSVCSAQRKIFVIARVFEIMQFDNMLKQFFNCSYRGSTSVPTRIIEPSNYRTFTCSKSTVETVEQGLKKICSKLTIKTPERHQLTSLRCLYCKLYTHFTTCLVFVLLTLNMQLIAGQLSSFSENM